MSGNAPYELGRRDFIRIATLWIGGLIGAAVAAPAVAFLLSPAFDADEEGAWMDLGPLAEYPLGLPTLIEFARTRVHGWERTAIPYGVFVVRLDERSVRVFSNVCTHLGCRVNWRPTLQHYISPCHDGHFDLLGKNVSGPPPRPLDEFQTRVEESRVYIQLPAFRRTL
jgi:menaquinol-cytochrome c reductase iron-sulfur subunit